MSDNDTIDDGDGIVIFDDNVFGIYNSDENAYLGFDGISKYYFDENNDTLIVKSGSHELKINNFDINHKEKTGKDFFGDFSNQRKRNYHHSKSFGSSPDDVDTTGFITNGKFQAVLDGLENFVIQKISNNIFIKDLVFKRDNK